MAALVLIGSAFTSVALGVEARFYSQQLDYSDKRIREIAESIDPVAEVGPDERLVLATTQYAPPDGPTRPIVGEHIDQLMSIQFLGALGTRGQGSTWFERSEFASWGDPLLGVCILDGNTLSISENWRAQHPDVWSGDFSPEQTIIAVWAGDSWRIQRPGQAFGSTVDLQGAVPVCS